MISLKLFRHEIWIMFAFYSGDQIKYYITTKL